MTRHQHHHHHHEGEHRQGQQYASGRHEEHHLHSHEGHNDHDRSHDSSKSSRGYGTSSSGKSDTYGCWVGTPLSYTGQTLEQDKSPHITLKFTQGSSKTYEAQINVASTSNDTKLVYWLNQNFSHPLTQTLSSLDEGFHQATSTDGTGLSLDFLRTQPQLFNFASGQIVQDQSPSSNNDILSELEPIIKSAISNKSTVYIFGRDYQTGIDDVHMNQGNTGNYENDVGKDGGLLFKSGNGNGGQWTAVFLAFEEQEIPTDDQTGKPESGAKALSTIAKGGVEA